MNTNTPIDWPHEEIKAAFAEEMAQRQDLLIMNLSTLDGFKIAHANQATNAVESDKVAAIASSLCALSNSVAREMLNSRLDIINVEADDGHVLFLNVNLRKLKGVLTVTAHKDISLAEARYVAKRLKTRLEEVMTERFGMI